MSVALPFGPSVTLVPKPIEIEIMKVKGKNKKYTIQKVVVLKKRANNKVCGGKNHHNKKTKFQKP